jgi:cation diffusion facilitator family transporter
LKELLAQFATRLGKKYDSPLLIADGWHHRSDALSSLFILTGIIFGKFFWWMDGVLGILMAFLLFYAAFDILKTSISHLIGEEPSAKLKSDIMKLITTNIDQQIHLHHLHVHHYGDHLEVTFHIRLKPETMLKDAHQITDKIEKLLRNEMNIEATIHVEPFYRPDQNDQSK